MKLKLGISTCPNDTFAFHAILNHKVDLKGLDFQIELLDVQQLNERLAEGSLDYSKASFHAALHLTSKYGVLQAGSALGIGVGPILISAGSKTLEQNSRVLCPGEWTTASLLFRCLHPGVGVLSNSVFSEIMPALKSGITDFGVVIHEGRFTYESEGLTLVEDLGSSWERLTNGVVPLGGILGRREIPEEIHRHFNSVLRDSINYAYLHSEEVFETMKQHAQELNKSAIWKHVELYVNEYTLDLGKIGQDALGKMRTVALSAGLINAGNLPLQIL